MSHIIGHNLAGSGKPVSEVTINTNEGKVGLDVNVQDQIARIEVASATITYIGKAKPGTATSAAAWKIKRIDTATANTTIILYGAGSTDYNQIWDNRAALVYS